MNLITLDTMINKCFFKKKLKIRYIQIILVPHVKNLSLTYKRSEKPTHHLFLPFTHKTFLLVCVHTPCGKC
jgi:hypothetical protein